MSKHCIYPLPLEFLLERAGVEQELQSVVQLSPYWVTCVRTVVLALASGG